MESRGPLPTPNQWLDQKLRELGYSNAQFARIIGRSRTEVQRWVNGREQIPRHHLAEVAAYIGAADDLEYALKIKECEDFGDALRRKLKQLARLSRSDPETLESSVFKLLHEKTTDSSDNAGGIKYASTLLYNITRAIFVYRVWADVMQSSNFSDLLAPEHMKLHLQYPTNHFLGLALEAGQRSEFSSEQVMGAMQHLRKLASDTHAEGVHELPRHHAIHMLARIGNDADQSLVHDLVSDAANSSDPLSVRLGYVGLIVRTKDQGIAEKYLWHLQKDEDLALADVMFEALHYGDTELGISHKISPAPTSFEKSLESVIRRFKDASTPHALLELEAFRLTGIMDRLGDQYFKNHAEKSTRLIEALAQTRDEPFGAQVRQAQDRLRSLGFPET